MSENQTENVECPIHEKVPHVLTFQVDGKTWGEEMCFRCVAEVVNDLVHMKQKHFAEQSSGE